MITDFNKPGNSEINRIVRHKRKGDLYGIVGLGLMKVGDAADWTPSVSYVKEGDDRLFTRDQEKFVQNFERADDDFPLGKACDLSGEGPCEGCQ